MRFRQSLFLFLALSLLAGLGACSDPAKREAKYISRGIALFDAGEYAKARLEFKNAARVKPTDAEVYFRLGLVDEAEGDLRNAFANFIHATEQDARHRPAQLKIAQYYLAAEQYGEVESRLGQVMADDPDNAEGHALRGALALRRQNFAETESETRLALRKDPANIVATSVLTGLHVARNDEAGATRALEAGIAANPKDLSLQVLKVAVYRRLDNVAKVEEAYRTIFALKPAERRYRTEFAKFYLELGRIDEAESVLRGAIAALPDDWEMKRQLVQFLSERRGLEPADDEVRHYMAAAPKNSDLYFWLADLYVRHHATDRAVALLEEVVAQSRFEPPGLNARTSLAKISFARGDRTLALKLVAIVLESAPGNHEALFMRAAMAYDLGRFQSAVADLRSILRDRPRSPDALQMLAEALARQGRLDLAIDNLSQLVEVEPMNSGARVRLAQMLHLNGDSKRAMATLALVTKAHPAYPIGWESTARIATDIKDWPTAEAAIARLSEIDGYKLTATYLRGMVLAGTNRPDEASRQFTEVVTADPNAPLAEHALTALVIASRAQKRIETVSHFIETLRTDSPFVTTVLGECYAELGKLDDAARAFDKAIVVGPGRAEPYLDRARLLLAQREVERAMEVLKQGSAAVPSDSQMPMMLADLLGAAGRHQEAAALYDELLARNPGLDIAANNLAELIADYQYEDPVALDKARRVAERFLGATNPLLLDTLGWVYYRQGNLNQASSILERAVGAGNVPAQVHYHYGAVLSKLERKELARTHLELATQTPTPYVGVEDARRLLQSL